MTSGPLRVFAVEDTAVQLTWTGMPARELTVGVGDTTRDVQLGPPAWRYRRGMRPRRLSDLPGGPGAVVVDGLQPGRRYPLWWRVRGGPVRTAGEVRTLRPPPGELCYRIATVSDLHIGERAFDLLGSLREVSPRPAGLAPYPERAAAAAVAEATAWGAATLLAKGDLTSKTRPAELATVASLLGAAGVPVLAQLGNHDVRRGFDAGTALPGIEVALAGRPVVADRPGVRLVLGHSPRARDRWGHLGAHELHALADALADADRPCLLSLHHPPERHRLPTSYPPGVAAGDVAGLRRALGSAGPTVLIAGHTHRNRTYRLEGRVVAEVGSTKDFPGVWAGYAVHEGGVRQVVRRIAEPSVLAWTESTAGALGGLWGRWSPGRLSDRCWSLPWSAT